VPVDCPAQQRLSCHAEGQWITLRTSSNGRTPGANSATPGPYPRRRRSHGSLRVTVDVVRDRCRQRVDVEVVAQRVTTGFVFTEGAWQALSESARETVILGTHREVGCRCRWAEISAKVHQGACEGVEAWPMSLHFSGNGLEPNDEDRIRIVLPALVIGVSGKKPPRSRRPSSGK
jgi:hypothetical protein